MLILPHLKAYPLLDPLSTTYKSLQMIARESLRREVSHALFSYGYISWEASSEQGLVKVNLILEQAAQYAQAGEWHQAATIYDIVANEILNEYERVDDEERQLAALVERCITGLGKSLVATEEPLERQMMLRALFNIYRADLQADSQASHEIPNILVAQCGSEEKEMITAWIDEQHTATSHPTDEMLKRLLPALSTSKSTLNEEEYLRRCRERGNRLELVEALLRLERLHDAATEAQQADNYTLLAMADSFITYEHPKLAYQLIQERVQHHPAPALMMWLTHYAKMAGQLDNALHWSEQLFWSHPMLTSYQDLKKLAQTAGHWESLRPRLLARLEQMNYSSLLTEIYLEDDDVSQALESLSHLAKAEPLNTSLTVQVARAAERKHPKEAIRLYLDNIHRLIQSQRRENYASAATYLLRVRDLYTGLDKQSAWQQVINNIRQSNPIRLLKEELSKARL